MLAVAPSSRGLGFAVLESQEKLVDWGVKSIRGDKKTACLAKTVELIQTYQPGIIVLDDASAPTSRRSPRIRQLISEIVAVAEREEIKVLLLSRERVKKILFGHDQATKQAVAEMLAARFPHELGFRLPPKRRPWMSEDYRMDIFDAVALAIACGLKGTGNRIPPSDTALLPSNL
ncbi:MAG: hypothetical protein WDN67_05020 [Candidatus Moraniibacteriota bacterium]